MLVTTTPQLTHTPYPMAPVAQSSQNGAVVTLKVRNQGNMTTQETHNVIKIIYIHPRCSI